MADRSDWIMSFIKYATLMAPSIMKAVELDPAALAAVPEGVAADAAGGRREAVAGAVFRQGSVHGL